MIKKFLVALAICIAAVGCTRIETGEVGLRVNASKQIEGSELLEGSWNQTAIGDVLTFPIRDIALKITDATPLTAENTKLRDLDFTVIYNLNPQAVSEMWARKSRSFHHFETEEKDWLLMYNYMRTVSNNAAQKTVRKYEALKVTDARDKIEQEIAHEISVQLKIDKLESDIIVTSIRVQNISPNEAIVNSATDLVKAQNQLQVAEAQVKIADAEARRMKALADNGQQSIAYMNAQAQMKIAEAVAAGKVNTIILPYDFKGIVNAGNK